MAETHTSATVSVTIAATPETVFGHLVEPDRMLRWMGAAVALDPRPGGAYTIKMNDEATASGHYVEVVPYERLVFTWGWIGDDDIAPGSTTVEIHLKPVGDSTELTLVHTDLPSDQARANHLEGWSHFLSNLVALHAAEP